MISKVEVSEKPILFSASMVRAILEGKKTQTRRVINPQPAMHLEPSELPDTLGQWFDEYGVYWRCPYGRPGNRLWVKETFVKFDPSHWPPRYGYKADMPVARGAWLESEQARKDLGYKWSPSIFMPRAASRLTLEVLNIRVERVQEIHRRDAQAEGVLCSHCYGYSGRSGCTCVDKFSVLWESINAKPRPRYTTENGSKVISHYESFPWEDVQENGEYRGKPWYVYGNPYVWAVGFKENDS